MIYKFCLSSDVEITHEIEIKERGDDGNQWESFLQIIQEKFKMSKVTYLELVDHSLSRIGERIRNVENLYDALKGYQDGMIFKVYGKLAVSSGIVVTKKSSKSPRLQEASLDSLLTPSSTTSLYDPLSDFQNNSLRKSSSSTISPREDGSLTSPREAPTIVKKSKQLRSTFSTASSESSSSDVHSDIHSPRVSAPHSTPVSVSSRQKSNSLPMSPSISLEEKHIPTTETTLIHELMSSSPTPDEATSLHPEQEAFFCEEFPAIGLQEACHDPISRSDDVDTVPIQEESASPESAYQDIVPTLGCQKERLEPKPNFDEDLRKEESRWHQDEVRSAPPLPTFSQRENKILESSEVEEQEVTLDRFANTLSLDFSSSLQSILAGLSRLEHTIGSPSLEESNSTERISTFQNNHYPSSSFDFDFQSPSRPNMASLKTSAELEAERLEQEALEAKEKQEEEARRLREMMDRERKLVTESQRIGNLKSNSFSPDRGLPVNQTITFTLSDSTHPASLSIPDHAEWMDLTNAVGNYFDIEPSSITHFVLLDEDDDEISGKLNEPIKFWKIFEKYSTLSGRYFSVYYDPKLVKVNPVPTVQHPPIILESDESQIDDRKQVSLYKRERPVKSQQAFDDPNEFIHVKQSPSITESQTPVEEVYDFRLSTDYIDEQNPISIPKNASWEMLTSILLNQLKNITPTQKLTSTVSKISLFDDDGDEIVGNIDNEDSFWKVISSRYKKNRTIFVVNLLTTASSTLSSSISSPLLSNGPPPNSLPIFCRLAGSQTNQKEIIFFPISSNWDQLNKIICDHWKLHHQVISTISLFDNENDELFGGITNEKKFWKCYKTHYNKQYTEFVFTLIDSIPLSHPVSTVDATSVAPSSPATTAAAAPPPWNSLSLLKTKHREKADEVEKNSELLSLRFRRFDQNDDIAVTIGIPLHASWNLLVSTLLTHFELDLNKYQVDHIDLVDNEGDLYGTFTKEQKFWKSVQTTYKKSPDLVYVLTVTQQETLSSANISLVSEPQPITSKSIPLNFRLRDDDAITAISIPDQASWAEITKTICQHFNYGEASAIKSIELVDEDGDDLVGRILNEKKFWKVVATGYSVGTIFLLDMNVVKPLSKPKSLPETVVPSPNRSETSFVPEKLLPPVATRPSHASAPKLSQPDGRPIYFCSSLENFSSKTILTIPENSSWEEIDQILQQSFDLNELESVTLSAIRLIDDDGDEYCDVITDSEKFWKILNSRYTHSGDLSFTFTWANNPKSSSNVTKNGLKVQGRKMNDEPISVPKPTRSLPFRLHNEDASASTNILIPENGSWSEITQSINQTYNFPVSTVITHVDLLDEDGDEITVGIHNETKFWKFINKNKMINFMILIWFTLPLVSPEEEEDDSEELVKEEGEDREKSHPIIPFYFRLSTDSLTDKGVVEIPWNVDWEEICLSLVDFFEIDSKNYIIESLSLVDDDGHDLITKISSPQQFWQIIQTNYHFDSMVFVIFLKPLRLQLSFQFQLKSKILDIGIYENSDWNEICDIVLHNFSTSSSSIESFSLMDEDGDEVFSKISDGRKFWKAAKSKYKKNETVFLILMSEIAKSTSSSSSRLDPPTTHSSVSSSMTTTSSRNTASDIGSASVITTPTLGPPTTVVIKKHKLQQQQHQEDQKRNPIVSSESSKPAATPNISTSRAIPQVDPAKFEGRYVPLSFKLSTDEIDDEILISIPAMGSWDQICNAILQSFPDSTSIDRLDLLDDDGMVLLNNIVSSSKFWKACLEQYRENETIFNIFVHPIGTSSKFETNGSSNVTSMKSKNGVSRGEGGNKRIKSSAITFESFLSACSDNNSELVNEIIHQHIVNITDADDRGLTASHVAAINGSLDVMKILLEYSNTFLTLRDHEGMTPLHYACEVNQTNVVHYLIESGADISLRNKMGMTCLHYIAINGNLELATAYVTESMVNVATNSGLTLLHFASDMGHVAMVKYLLLKHANVHCRDDEGLIPLHLACISNHLDCVKVLITIGSSYCNLRDDEGMSCLLHACKEGNLEIVKYLSEPSSTSSSGQGNLLARNDHYESCLHLACLSGSLNLVKYLLQKKVDINARNDNNETPLEVASKVGNDVIANWLEDRGGVMRPETKDEMMTRKQIDMKSEKAIRAFEAEELLNLERC